MKKFQLAGLFIILLTLTGCCDCFDHPPFIEVHLEGYNAAELKTIYVVDNVVSDTCFACVDTTENLIWINARSNSRYEIASDSIPLHKTVQVNKITHETSGIGRCKCISNTRINYEYEGNFYTNEPIVITR